MPGSNPLLVREPDGVATPKHQAPKNDTQVCSRNQTGVLARIKLNSLVGGLRELRHIVEASGTKEHYHCLLAASTRRPLGVHRLLGLFIVLQILRLLLGLPANEALAFNCYSKEPLEFTASPHYGNFDSVPEQQLRNLR